MHTQTMETNGNSGVKARGPRIAQLRSLTAIARELENVYRQSRAGKIKTADLGRFSNCLNILAGVLRNSTIEERLVKLEEHMNAKRN